jgi:Flp pilus assembly protein TadG
VFKGFLANRSGNYGLATAIALVPIIGGIGVAVDYSEMVRQKQYVASALDATGLATARRVLDGATDAELIAYARDFFEANLGPVDPADTQLHVVLPESSDGGGILKLSADLDFKPKIIPAFNQLRNEFFGQNTPDNDSLPFKVGTDIRLKNTSEIALVLDNSGSMSQIGGGSSKKRIVLLREAATYLVEELAKQSANIRQVDKPVQFSVVPFSASVNVGPQMASEPWMDLYGKSAIHHENFDWSTMTEENASENGDKWAQHSGGVWYKRGTGWGASEGQPLTRFSLFADMQYYTSREYVDTGKEYICTRYRADGTCRSGYWQNTGYYVQSAPASYASWQGCVEARPYPYNVDDTLPSQDNPESLFVPMFAPDEPGNLWRDVDGDGVADLDGASWNYSNNWWADYQNGATNAVSRQRDMGKYFKTKPFGAAEARNGAGPNFSCTTQPITPLTDVTEPDGIEKVIAAIDAMEPTGMTDVPEGLAWGWRTVSSGEPYSEGRPEKQKGNDKVIIVLTDGANTYSDLNDNDPAGNKSTYAAYGYTGINYNGGSMPRMYMGTSSSVWKNIFTSTNYSNALNEQMESVCKNSKNNKVIIFMVALDLDNYNDTDAINSMRNCASESRYRKNADGSYKKLFWNTQGSDLMDVFKAIADELSNLRIVG